MSCVVLGIVRSTCRLTESELRYQLAKRGDALAESDDLLRVLLRMEQEGLVRTELTVTLGEAAQP